MSLADRIANATVITPTVIGNVEAEACLLGGLMQTGGQVDVAADILTPGDFAEALHGRIFQAILKEHSQGHTITPITLKPYFEGDPTIKELGGVGYLAQLSGGAIPIGAKGLAEQIAELAVRRRLVERLREALASANDYDFSNDEISSVVEAALAEATKTDRNATELGIGQCAAKALKAMERHDPGMTSGIESLDRALGPIRKKDFAIIAGRPGMFKTGTALCYGKGVARKGHGVLYFTLEMSDEALGERALADEAFDEEYGGVPYSNITSSHLDRDQMRALVEAQERLDKLPLKIVDIAGLTPSRLSSAVRRWKRKFEAQGQSLDLVIVDYLQIMRAPGLSDRFSIVTEISQSLRELCKANNLAVLALAQLSRRVEERTDRRPHLSDLRESGQLEQDADTILFLYREEYYLRKIEPHPNHPDRVQWEDLMREHQGKIDFIGAKSRRQAETTAQGRYYGAYQAIRG